jgi:hypothetical protein
MTYATLETAPRDAHWIDRDCSEDISYWMQEFGVTEDALLCAIGQVGPCPDAVRQHFHVRSMPGAAHAL